MNKTTLLRMRLTQACDESEARESASSDPEACPDVAASCRRRIESVQAAASATDLAATILESWVRSLDWRQANGDLSEAATVGSLLRNGVSITADVLGEAAIVSDPRLARVINRLREGPFDLDELVCSADFDKALSEALHLIRNQPARFRFFREFLKTYEWMSCDGEYERTRRLPGHLVDELEASLPEEPADRRPEAVSPLIDDKLAYYRTRVTPEDRLKRAALEALRTWLDIRMKKPLRPTVLQAIRTWVDKRFRQ